MKPDDVNEWITSRFSGLAMVETWGETAWFYNPGGRLKRGVYFMTLKQRDSINDAASNLGRPGAWRLNFGPPRPAFTARFGAPPARPAKGGFVEGPWDFHALDRLTPHPIYGWMSWVALVSPCRATLAAEMPLIEAAYDKARAGWRKRVGDRAGDA